MRSKFSTTSLALGAVVLANLLAFAPLPLELRLLSGLMVFVAIPGWLLLSLIGERQRHQNGSSAGAARGLPGLPPAEKDTGAARGDELLTALGLGYCAAMGLGLGLYLLVALGARTQLQPWHVLLAANGLNLALAALVARRSSWTALSAGPPDWRLVLVVAVAAAPRLWDLGWSEFQGDEARVLLRTMAAIQGVPDALLAHRKVPGEILFMLPLYTQLGSMTELAGRLPFTLAGLAAIAAFYSLVRELFDPRVALIAGLLMALNGYAVAFGRILQYDSLASLLGTLSLLAAVRFWRAGTPSARTALTGSLLLAGTCMVALGAVFFAAPVAVIVGARLLTLQGNRWRWLLLWSWPVLLALLVTAIVLALETLGPLRGGVLSYLGPRFGGQRVYWNGAALLASANHYLSTFLLVLTLGAGALTALRILVRLARAPRLRTALLGVGLALIVAGASWFRPEAAGLLAALLTGGLLVSARAEPLGTRAMLAWAAGPLIVHSFLVRFPGTHWREAFPGLIVLLALALSYLWTKGPPRLRPALAVSLAVAVATLFHFSWVTLVQRWPEYHLVYPEQRHWLDWSGNDGRGVGGIFGVSHRHGWKELALLQEQGELPLSAATNESPAIAAWYLRRPQACPPPLEVGLRAPRAPQDRNLTGPVPIPADFVTTGRVLVEERPTVTLLRPRDSGLTLGSIHAGARDAEFDARMTSPMRPIGPLYQPDLGASAGRRDCQVVGS